MLSPEAELESLVCSLEEVSATDRSHLSVAEVRVIVAKAIRATHQIILPECSLGPANRTLRLALLDLDRGSPLPKSGI